MATTDQILSSVTLGRGLSIRASVQAFDSGEWVRVIVAADHPCYARDAWRAARKAQRALRAAGWASVKRPIDYRFTYSEWSQIPMGAVASFHARAA